MKKALTGFSPSTLLRWYLGMEVLGMWMPMAGERIRTAGAVWSNALWLPGMGLERCFVPWSFVFCSFCLILFSCNKGTNQSSQSRNKSIKSELEHFNQVRVRTNQPSQSRNKSTKSELKQINPVKVETNQPSHEYEQINPVKIGTNQSSQN